MEVNMFNNIISVYELSRYIGKSDTIIIDIRKKDKYNKEHIPGAISINEDKIYEIIEKYIDYKLIVIYCDYGNAAMKIVQELCDKYNCKNIYNLYGGYNAYKNRKLE